MFVFENVRAFLDCDYMAAWCACARVRVCFLRLFSVRTPVCVFPREVIFSSVMNPDGENLFLYPLLLLSSSPSGSDSRVRLCFLLALWFMVVMIYCVWAARRQLQVPLLLPFLLLASPPPPLSLSLCACLLASASHAVTLSLSLCL